MHDSADVAALIKFYSGGVVKQDGSQLAFGGNWKNDYQIKWIMSLHSKLLALGKLDDAIDILHYIIELCDANMNVQEMACDYLYYRKQAVDLKLKAMYARLGIAGYEPTVSDFLGVLNVIENNNFAGLDYVNQVIKLFTFYFG